MPIFHRNKPRTHIISTGLVIALVLLVVTFPPASADTPFVHEIIDHAPGVVSTSLAFDSRWRPHVAYLLDAGAPSYEVWHAYQNPDGTWIYDFVAFASNLLASGLFVAIAIDAGDAPNFLYVDEVAPLSRELIHAVDPGGGWAFTPITNVGPTGGYGDLSASPYGGVHASFQDANTGEVQYASSVTGWLVEVIGPSAEWTGVAVDPSDPFETVAHVCYYDPGPTELWYAKRSTGGVWSSGFIDGPAVGTYCAIALDGQGNPHISYMDFTGGVISSTLNHAFYDAAGVFSTVVVDPVAGSGVNTSIEVDQDGDPHISHWNFASGALRYAEKQGAVWVTEAVLPDAGEFASIALGPHGNPHISHADEDGNPMLSDAAIHLIEPHGFQTWPVGSEQAIQWRGAGPVNLYLSVDGGNSFDRIASNLYAGPGGSNGLHVLRVPHRPSRFCVVKAEREIPFSESVSDSFITIDVDVALLSFVVSIDDLVGNVLEWETEPGLADLAGYRLDKYVRENGWRTIVPFTDVTRYHDRDGAAGDRYRLFAVNGLGHEIKVGEAAAAPAFTHGARLSAWPVPFRGGELSIGVQTIGALGASSADVTVEIYDVKGRRVRTVAEGRYPPGTHVLTWDGRGADGVRVPAGVYFIRSQSGGVESTQKIVVVR